MPTNAAPLARVMCKRTDAEALLTVLTARLGEYHTETPATTAELVDRFIHDLAHWLVLGQTLRSLPRDYLQNEVGEMLDVMRAGEDLKSSYRSWEDARGFERVRRHEVVVVAVEWRAVERLRLGANVMREVREFSGFLDAFGPSVLTPEQEVRATMKARRAYVERMSARLARWCTGLMEGR